MNELDIEQLQHEVKGARLQIKQLERRLEESDTRWERRFNELDARWERIEAYLSGKCGMTDGDESLVPFLKGITTRQHVILQLFITGMAYEQMADRMSVSINTIKTQAKSVRAKWEVDNRSDLIYRARKAMAAVSDEEYVRLSGGIPKDWADKYAHGPRESDPYWHLVRPTRGGNYDEGLDD